MKKSSCNIVYGIEIMMKENHYGKLLLTESELTKNLNLNQQKYFINLLINKHDKGVAFVHIILQIWFLILFSSFSYIRLRMCILFDTILSWI